MYRSLLVILTLGVLVVSLTNRNPFGTHVQGIVLNFSTKATLPRKSVLFKYVDSLQKVTDFCSRNKYDLDLNLEFGVFLTNVNLKFVVMKKYKALPKKIHNLLKKILDKNDGLIEFFTNMVNKNQNPGERSNKMITSLFINETKWISRVRQYDHHSITLRGRSEQFHGKQIRERYASIYEYIEDLKHVEKWVPTPGLSDMCFASLAENPDYKMDLQARCNLEEPCYRMLKNGTDFGYALSHRLLLLLNAQFARGCYIFSMEKDRKLTEKFCNIAYDEIEYVTKEGYQIIDLILELITLCAMEGHSHFLREDWITNSLRFQTGQGCFAVTVPSKFDTRLTKYNERPKTWQLAKKNHRLLGGLCDGHVTSVAAATLSAAIRYILETNY
ncbi:unnamed protein product [Chilo suppressalis]|uniref:Uncharacterized protein n=1 Tax=Chilo suppressalis TaxID=168631 RepID=A0ABN8BDQ8_CHISP|nr:unnamed protein product [Chilo suppressalis]